MKIIINTSNIVVGGGIQVAYSVIQELKKIVDNEYHIFLSSKLIEQIEKDNFLNNFIFYDFPISPSKLSTRRNIVKKLDNLESEIRPDIVLSVFGPAYWTPKATHVSGFADGWCYNPKTIAYSKLSNRETLKYKLTSIYKNYFIKKASYLIVETVAAKNSITQYLNYPIERIFVVGNTYNSIYNNYDVTNSTLNGDVFEFITVSAFYPHKNLSIINEVTKILEKKTNKKIIFKLTIDNDNYETHFLNNKCVINLGPQKVEDCPPLYTNSNALFLPTLIETFTASYPEAMKMERPIVTSNLDFATDICGDAALYFDPLNPEDIAEKILELVENENLQKRLIANGNKILPTFETAESRTKKYIDLLKSIITKQ